MKKIFKRFILLLIIFVAGYFFVTSILIVPEGYRCIVKSKTSGTLHKNFYKRINFVWQKGIPFNTKVVKLPLNFQKSKFDVKKKIVIFHKEIENVYLRINLKWKINKQKFITLASEFSTKQMIENYFKMILQEFLDKKVDYILAKRMDFRKSFQSIEKEISDILNEKAQKKGIEIINIEVIPKHIPYFLSIDRLYSYAEKLTEFQVIGKYIKENPIILKYLLIQKINKNTSLTIMPESNEWYGNKNKKDSGKK